MTSIVNSQAYQKNLGISPTSALFVGDSITDYARVAFTTTSVTAIGNNQARVVRTNHALSVGQRMSILAAADPTVNVMRATIVSVVDANTFDVFLNGPTHTVSGSAPVIMLDERASTRGWVNWLETFSGEPLRRTWCALGGAKTTDIIDLLPKLSPGREDIAFVCIGMNDIYSAGDSLATMQTNFSTMIQMVQARVDKVVVLSVPPRDSSGGAPWTEARQTIHTGFNRWLYDQCILNGWVFVDTWISAEGGATYVNGAATNPDPLAAMVHDTTHPSMRGAKAIGAAVYAKVSGLFGTTGWRAPHPDAIGADVGNLLTASQFATDTAGVATNWSRTDVTASMNAVFTMEARTVAADGDACGRNQVMTINYGAAAGTASCRFRRDNIQGLLTAGVTYRLIMPISVTGALGLIGLEGTMFGTLSDGTFLQVYAHNQDSNADPILGNFTGWWITPEFICPPNLSDLDVWVRPYINSAQTTDVVIKVWQPQLRVVS